MKVLKVKVTVEVVVEGACSEESHAAMEAVGKDLADVEDDTFHLYNAAWDIMRKAETQFEGDWSIGTNFQITHQNH